MQERLLIRTADDASVSRLDPGSAPRLPRRKRVVMADASHYRIAYAINPHMRSTTGALNQIDPKKALAQWNGVKQAYEDMGYKVDVIEADERYPDLVFTANTAFVYPDPHAAEARGHYAFIPSVMAHEQRQGEVPLVAEWLKSQGYRETPLGNVAGTFEGGGDLTWFGDKRILVGGVGSRTSAKSLLRVADLIEAPLVVLEMHDPDFYHLDTCLNFLDDRTALWVPNAFKTNTQKLLTGLVENLIEVDDLEARRGLAINCHSPDGRRVLMQQGNRDTESQLETAGYEVIPVDTSEFIKAGGSVFCLKMMIWA